MARIYPLQAEVRHGLDVSGHGELATLLPADPETEAALRQLAANR